jgi:hypothetical protein
MDGVRAVQRCGGLLTFEFCQSLRYRLRAALAVLTITEVWAKKTAPVGAVNILRGSI